MKNIHVLKLTLDGYSADVTVFGAYTLTYLPEIGCGVIYAPRGMSYLGLTIRTLYFDTIVSTT